MSIIILDENDNSPQFDLTSDVSVIVPENTPMGRRVAVVLARDKDADKNGLVRTKIPPMQIMWFLSRCLMLFSSFSLGELHISGREHEGYI